MWGGGRYPVANLFNFADEHGILIWMETMFACAPYPRDPDFLNNVAAEVTQQVSTVELNIACPSAEYAYHHAVTRSYQRTILGPTVPPL